jgi:hypothetical protein
LRAFFILVSGCFLSAGVDVRCESTLTPSSSSALRWRLLMAFLQRELGADAGLADALSWYHHQVAS